MFSKSEGLGQRTETGNVGTSGRGRQQCPARVSQLHCSYSVALGPWSCWGRWQRSPTCCTLSERIDEDKILLHKGTNKEARLSLPWFLEDKKKKILFQIFVTTGLFPCRFGDWIHTILYIPKSNETNLWEISSKQPSVESTPSRWQKHAKVFSGGTYPSFLEFPQIKAQEIGGCGGERRSNRYKQSSQEKWYRKWAEAIYEE